MQKTIEKVISIQYFILSREKKTFPSQKRLQNSFQKQKTRIFLKRKLDAKKKFKNSKFPRKIKQELGIRKRSSLAKRGFNTAFVDFSHLQSDSFEKY